MIPNLYDVFDYNQGVLLRFFQCLPGPGVGPAGPAGPGTFFQPRPRRGLTPVHFLRPRPRRGILPGKVVRPRPRRGQGPGRPG